MNYLVTRKLQVTKIQFELTNEIIYEQPLLKGYPKCKFDEETFTRPFNPDFYKVDLRLSYSVVLLTRLRYKFNLFELTKTEKLEKHNKSKNHLLGMAKCVNY